MAWLARGIHWQGQAAVRPCELGRRGFPGGRRSRDATLETYRPFEDLIRLVDRLAPAAENGKRHEAQAMLAAAKPRCSVGMLRFQNGSPSLDPLAIIQMDQPADRFEERGIHSALLEACAPAKLVKHCPEPGRA